MNKLAKTTLLGATLIAMLGSVTAGYANEQGGKRQRINFEQLDADADGFITKAEMQAAHAARFAENDTDGDGFLNSEELQASKGKMRKGGQKGEQAKEGKEPNADRQARMMRYMDENGDGKVALSEIPTDRTDKMFDRLDADEDGKISKAELEAAKKNRKGGKNKKG
jgi:Ca2+-binding EF-hand superfamily protein